MTRHPITQSDAATQAAALANNERFCRDIGVECEPRRFNVKATFVGGKLDNLEFADFGPVPNDYTLWPFSKAKASDCLISWPINPEFSGRSAVAEKLGVPVTSRFFSNL